MDIVDINSQLDIFKKYTDKFINMNDEHKALYIDKQDHSVFVMNESLQIDKTFTQYNEDFKRLLAIESLYHDIGRFEQMKLTGTFADYDLKIYKDHGDLGKEIIKTMIRELIPKTNIYDIEIGKVISLHAKVNDLTNMINEKYLKFYKQIELKEIFNYPNELNSLTALNTVIVQDTDRLDIFRKILKGIWIPDTSSEVIDEVVWEYFLNNQFPSISYLKNNGLWNKNVGHLVRLNFINYINLIPILKKIKDEKLIEQIFEKTIKGTNGENILERAYANASINLDKLLDENKDKMLIKRKLG